MKWFSLMCVAAFMGISTSAQAAYVLSLENVTVTAGNQAVVGVFISSDNNQLLTGYTFPIEIGGNGRGLASGLSFPADPAAEVTTFTTVGITQLGSDILPGPFVRNYEGIFFDARPLNASAIQLSTTPVRLFNLLVDTSASIPGGTVFPVSITDNSTPGSQFSLTTLNAVGGVETTVQTIAAGGSAIAGSITINAVPEPSSVALLTLAGVASGVYVRFRRRPKI
jgi:hypothetical protein